MKRSRLAVIHRLLGLVILACALGACPGSLPPDLLGTGNGGTGGPNVCDAPALMGTQCAQTICHSPSTKSSGLDLTPAGVAGRLLNVAPTAALSTSCGTITTPYLQMGTTPATGLLLSKLKPGPPDNPCGSSMPFALPLLTQDQINCIQEWSTAVTTGVITP